MRRAWSRIFDAVERAFSRQSRVPSQKIGEAENGRQRVVDFMGGAGDNFEATQVFQTARSAPESMQILD